jgi:hypothetical protein
MSDTKVYQFGEQGTSNSLLASILPSLQNKGVDTGYLLGMLGNNNNGGLFGGRGFEDIIALIIVAAIFGNGNFGFGGFGGNGGGNFIASTAEREMLMSAIQRNGVDLSQLAQTLGCSNSRIQDAIGQVSTQLCNFAGQNGLSFQQVINSIQAGNAALASQIASCCCDIRTAIADSNYVTERGFCNTNQNITKGFSDLGYATRDQTCAIEKAIADSTQQILAGQAAIEKRELQREIATLQEEKQTYKLGNMMAQNNAPLAAAISALQSDVDGIKCRLPRTEVIPATPEYVAVNRSINVGYQPFCLNGYGVGYGTGWNNGCCNGNAFSWG